MKLQTDNYSCGPVAIVNACLALGHEHDVAQVSQLAGTTSSRGTDEKGIKSALTHLGYFVTEITQRSSLLWSTIFVTLVRGQSVILCVDGVDHWVAVIGSIGGDRDNGKLVIFDSERTAENKSLNGVHVCDQGEFVARLGGSRYAIGVGDITPETDSVGNELMDSLTKLVGTPSVKYDRIQMSDDNVPDEIFTAIFGEKDEY